MADQIGRWLSSARSDPAATLAGVVARVAATCGSTTELRVDGAVVAPDPLVAAAAIDEDLVGQAGPWLIGLAREALAGSRAARRTGGVHHTPPAVVGLLVAEALAAVRGQPQRWTVADPSVGGGVFLLGAVESMEGPRAARLGRVVGWDVDPLAVAATEAALSVWSGGAPVPAGALRVGDFLAAEPSVARPTVVVGNPPFLSQMRAATVRGAEERDSLRSRWGELGAYVDTSVAFLLAALDLVDDGGAVALVQPASFLSARDAEGARARVVSHGEMVALWVDDGRVFDAAVDTVAPVVRRSAVPTKPCPVRRVVGGAGRAAAPVTLPPADSWAPLVADLGGVPDLDPGLLRAGRVLGDVAHLTAGFRDEFYGLRGAVVDDLSGSHRLVTSGLIDPLESRWGSRPARFDRRRFRHPVVVADRADPAIRGWLRDRMVPKVLVASQTRVVEAVVDAHGSWVPSTPVVSVEPRAGAPSLWHLAAALTSPVVAAIVLRDMAGSGLSPDAVRVSARRLGGVPLPEPGRHWDEAARAAAAMQAEPSPAALRAVARATLRAYGLDGHDHLFDWWVGRLPRRERG